MAEPTWKLLHRIADAAYPGLRKAFESLIAPGPDPGLGASVASALARGDTFGATAALVEALEKGEPAVRAAIQKALVEIFQKFTDPELAARLTDGIIVHFNLTNPRVFDWINGELDRFFDDLDRHAREAVREIVATGFVEGWHPSRMARELEHRLGLPSGYRTAVDNYRRELERLARSGDAPDIPQAVMDKLRRSGFRSGRGLSPARIDQLLEAYARRLRRDYAVILARTATIQASAEAQRELWKQALEQELITEAGWKVKWIITPDDRLCPVCRAMDGRQRNVTGTYENGSRGPTLHPQCRCAEGLVRV